MTTDNGQNMIKTVALLKNKDDEEDFEDISLNEEDTIDYFCDDKSDEEQQPISILQNTSQNFISIWKSNITLVRYDAY